MIRIRSMKKIRGRMRIPENGMPLDDIMDDVDGLLPGDWPLVVWLFVDRLLVDWLTGVDELPVDWLVALAAEERVVAFA